MNHTDQIHPPSSDALPNPSPFKSAWLEKAALVLGLFASTLALLGYGVALSIESMLGMPRAAIFESTLDLLDLSSVFFLELFSSNAINLFDARVVYRLYVQEWWFIGALLLVATLFYFFGQQIRKTIERWIRKFDLKAKARLNPEKSAAWLLALFAILHPLLVSIGLWVIIYCMVVLMLVPASGLAAGNRWIKEQVIEPQQCQPIATIQMRQTGFKAAANVGGALQDKPQVSDRHANCVVILKDDKLVAAGRVVYMTSKSVILLEPNGQARKVPLGDVMVQTVGSL